MASKQALAWSLFSVVLVIALLLVNSASAASQPRILYNFTGGIDGEFPMSYGNLAVDSKGNLYGTTEEGGKPSCGGICGTVFELSPSQGGWKKTTLYDFAGGVSDGAQPDSGVVFDGAGNLYGTTVQGGTVNCGTVYELSPNLGGGWTETVLHIFTGSDGCEPIANVTIDTAGNIYGTTIEGGANSLGAAYELVNTGGVWTETVLHSFKIDGTDGQQSFAPLATDRLGNLYGTTLCGGTNNFGTVFELTHNPDGSWTENVIYSFHGAGASEFPLLGSDF